MGKPDIAEATEATSLSCFANSLYLFSKNSINEVIIVGWICETSLFIRGHLVIETLVLVLI